MSIEIWIVWSVTLVIFGGIAHLDFIYRRRMLDQINYLESRLDVGMGQRREDLSAYKLEVAKSYTTTGYLKDVETRMTERLICVESKVDTAASAQ
jgi:hypothetical protein